MAEAHIVAHEACCITPQALRLLNHALVCTEGVAFDNAYGVSSLEVRPGGGMTVIIRPGSAFIEGGNFSGEGMYFVSNDGPVSLGIDPADPADPRCDLVIAQVDGTAPDCADAWVLTTITGVPAPVPACPVVPAGALALASITVAAGAVGIGALDISDEREAYSLCGAPGLPFDQEFVTATQFLNRPSGYSGLPNPVFASLDLPLPALVLVSLTATFGIGGGDDQASVGLSVQYGGSFVEAASSVLHVLRGADFPLNGGSMVRFLEIPAGTLNMTVFGGDGIGNVRGVDLEAVVQRWL